MAQAYKELNLVQNGGDIEEIEGGCVMSEEDKYECNIENKLKQIFEFLSNNRIYNQDLQKKFYYSTITPYNNVPDKILSLLYDTVNSQSRSNIDNKSKFFKYIHNNKKSLNSFKNFVKYINPNTDDINFNSLFEGLKSQGGWGPKTSALFVKNIFNIHNENYYSTELNIWDDVPDVIEGKDKIYLPVDTVIEAVFKKINPSMAWNFNKVNKKVRNLYIGKEIMIWDDLWYWGFITQNGSENKRKFGWNENKYWMLKDAPKDKKTVEAIKEKAEEFLVLIGKKL